MSSLVDFLLSGLLVRFPDLKLAYAESQIGWIPYVLERVDEVWEDNQGWAQTKHIPEPPSTYFHRNVYGCFFKDQTGIDMRDQDRDRPHHLRDRLPAQRLHLARLPSGRRQAARRARRRVGHKILRGNAIDLFQLDLT